MMVGADKVDEVATLANTVVIPDLPCPVHLKGGGTFFMQGGEKPKFMAVPFGRMMA